MATKKPKPQWSVNGHRFDPTASGSARPDVITLPVKGSCISNMPSSTGIPINGSLAVHFIENFLKFFTIHEREHDKCERFLDEGNLADAKESQKLTRKFVNRVVRVTSGTTFDKDLILKILSQPGCEGIRCYLCARDPESDSDDPYALSLVVVGVDGKGFDLNYNHKGTIKQSTVAGDDIVTQSLTGEYGSPPPPGDGIRSKATDKRYVLLNLANRNSII